jgi:hypothetical protein
LTPETSSGILKELESSGENMPRRKLDPNEPHIAPQVTLRGQLAYVFESLVEKEGVEPAEVARWIIKSWIFSEDGRRALRDRGIDPNAYRSNVVPMERKKKIESLGG